MTYTTKMEKGFHGLSAETEIDLHTPTDEGAMMLRVSSSKRYGGNVATTATVIYRKDTCSFSTAIFQDYSKTIATGKLARVTEKALAEFHAKSLEAIPATLLEVAAQYKLTAPSRTGNQAAIMAEETGINYNDCLIACNID